MRRELLRWLACPACRAPVRLDEAREADGHIMEGRLRCEACTASYPVVRGVPRMLRHVSDAATQQSFGYEWLHVQPTEYEEDVITFFRRTGLDPRLYKVLHSDATKEYVYPTVSTCDYRPDGSALQGKLVLEAGCGLGRYVTIAREHARAVIGVDFSDAVDRAFDVTRQMPNAHIVQGDLTAPPFAPGIFDFIYTIGVLHHTPHPASTFASVAPLCREGGTMSVSVYGRDYWCDPIRGTITKLLRLVTTRMPHAALLWWCRRIGLPLGRLQMWATERAWRRWILAPAFLLTIPRHRVPGVMVGDTFDMYSPRFIHVHTPEEVSKWFARAGFEAIHTLPVPTGVAVVATRSVNSRVPQHQPRPDQVAA